MGRLLERGSGEDALDKVDGYEAVTAPIYAWRDVIARYARAGPVLNGLATARAWRALGGGDRNGAVDGPDGAARAGGAGRPGASRERAGGWRGRTASARRSAIKGAFPLMVGGRIAPGSGR